MEQILIEIENLKIKIDELKKKLGEFENAKNFEGWVTRKTFMEFLDYGDTQIAALLKSGDFIVAEFGNRKFIKKDSVLQFLEKNITRR